MPLIYFILSISTKAVLYLLSYLFHRKNLKKVPKRFQKGDQLQVEQWNGGTDGTESVPRFPFMEHMSKREPNRFHKYGQIGSLGP